MAQCGKVTGSRDIQMCGVCSMSLLVDLPKILPYNSKRKQVTKLSKMS